jgi:hypothetical protein
MRSILYVNKKSGNTGAAELMVDLHYVCPRDGQDFADAGVLVTTQDKLIQGFDQRNRLTVETLRSRVKRSASVEDVISNTAEKERPL